MCGINGIISNSSNYDIISQMNKKIIHRGPDDQSEFEHFIMNRYVSFGMTRLSIIDLSKGNQPIYSKDKSLVIVFNGEIYNFQSLRQDLVNHYDIEFNTSSDTEVILMMYEIYGVESFSKLDGMFAFSILDKNIGKVFIARDFFGEKPLYYSQQLDSIIWGSELKSLMINLKTKPKINKEALSLYFQLTYIPAPYSIYDGVNKLLPNHYLEIDINTLSIKENEISNSIPHKTNNINFDKAKKISHDILMESVSSRSISDVPIGTFLSGGVDSSIVSLCLSKIKNIPIDTFSMGFEKKSFNETDKSNLVAKLINSNHHEFIVNEKSLEEDLENVILNYDEPFADSSALPTYLVSKLTSSHVKVALTGDGGDEVFGGYNKYYMGKINSIYTKTLPKSIHNNLLKYIKLLTISKEDKRGKRYKLRKLLESINYNNDFYKNIISLAFKSEELKELFFEDVNVIDSFFENKKMFSINDFRNIECRSPFLNKKIWNFTNSLPDDFLIKGWNKKYILKQAFKEYFPDQFLEKSKMGFAVPVGDWLRTILKNELISYINKDFLKNQNLFRTDYIIPLVQNHIDAKVDNTFRVWSFFCFQKWYTNVYKI